MISPLSLLLLLLPFASGLTGTSAAGGAAESVTSKVYFDVTTHIMGGSTQAKQKLFNFIFFSSFVTKSLSLRRS